MKIVFLVTRADNVGGAQIYVKNLATKYKSLEADVLVLAGTLGGLQKYCDTAGIRFVKLAYLKHPINVLYDVLAVFELIRLLKKEKPSIVSLSSSKAAIIGRIACYILKIPAVVTVHGWSFTEGIRQPQKRLFTWLEKSLAFCTRKVIVISQFDRASALRYKVMPLHKMELIYNGVPDDCITAPCATVKKDESLRLIMIARHGKPKDHVSLFQVMTKCKQAHAVFVGDGPLLERNMQMVKELGIASRTTFTGYQEDVKPLLKHSDIFVLLSEYEGFPLSTLEAMSCGLPVIVSDVCGAGEAVIQGYNGFKIKKGSIDQLADAIDFFIKNPEKIREMGANSYQLYKQSFSFDIMFKRTDEVFKENMLQG